MAELQDLGPVYRGEDVTLVVTMQPLTDITGWTLAFRLKQRAADVTPLLSIAGAITSAPSGIFTVSLSASQTTGLSAGVYAYDIWRTDSGFAAVLTIGTLTVRGTVRLP